MPPRSVRAKALEAPVVELPNRVTLAGFCHECANPCHLVIEDEDLKKPHEDEDGKINPIRYKARCEGHSGEAPDSFFAEEEGVLEDHVASYARKAGRSRRELTVSCFEIVA